MKTFRDLTTLVWDILEECFHTFSVPTGLHLHQMFLCSCILSIMSVLLSFTNYPIIIDWREAVFTSSVLCILDFNNTVSKKTLAKFKTFLGKDEYNE